LKNIESDGFEVYGTDFLFERFTDIHRGERKVSKSSWGEVEGTSGSHRLLNKGVDKIDWRLNELEKREDGKEEGW